MNLRITIEQIFNQNTDYARPEQAINQSESLNSLSRDLYTDARRFIYELLQNADDSALIDSKVKVAITLVDKQLVIAHSGKPFDKRDLRGLCGVNDGTKRNAIDKTGFKGIGFKAVFGQSEKVLIFSKGEYFRFDAHFPHVWKPAWATTKEQWEKNNDRTFMFPWQIIPIYTATESIDSKIHDFLINGNWQVATIITLRQPAEAIEAIKTLAEKVNMFLFLKNISEVTFHIGSTQTLQINRLINGEIALRLNNSLQARWLTRTIKLPIPTHLKGKLANDLNIPPKLKSADTIELSLAAKLGDDGIEALSANERFLYAYLPTEEQRYAIPVLVNSTFLTVANRETLHEDSVWNQWLFENIPSEIFKWIAELVKGKFQYQAYKILPERLSQSDALATAYNKGFQSALETISFIISETGELLRVDEAVIDFTFLYQKPFINRETVRQFIVNTYPSANIHAAPFVPKTGSVNKLQKLGIASLDWGKVPELFSKSYFLKEHTPANNTALIEHLKELSQSDKPADVNDNVLKKWPFILDHKGNLKCPKDIFTPAPDDLHWNNPNSELSFLHSYLQEWLLTKSQVRTWLGSLGVVEKSDLSYLEKTILPNASSFITAQNAVQTIQSLYSLYQKNEIGAEILNQLGELKLLTTTNTLVAANRCYFSDAYLPRMSLEQVVKQDIFLNSVYLPQNGDLGEWRRFFKFLGVREGITTEIQIRRLLRTDLEEQGFKAGYFDEENKKFTPLYTKFTADQYNDIITLFLLNDTESEVAFSKLFWQDVVTHLKPVDLLLPAIAFWGKPGRGGQITGDEVSNYMKWYIGNIACIPAVNNCCYPATSVIINDDEIKVIAGKYLPVFDGNILSSDWKSFFQFKTQLTLTDYLILLTQISADLQGDNKKRIQTIYEYLLDSCSNWSTEEQSQIIDWATTGKLQDQDGGFQSCTSLKHYLDGDTSIFQNAYPFIQLNKSNQQHANIMSLLSLLQVGVLRQSEFQLKVENEVAAIELSDKVQHIIPYLAAWINKETNEGYESTLRRLSNKISRAKFFESDELKITYGADWSKKVNLHVANGYFYARNPWSSNKTMLILPDKLCDYLELKGYRQAVDFLLRSTIDEIIDYFENEQIELPSAKSLEAFPTSSTATVVTTIDLPEKQSINYAKFWQENLTANATIIALSNNNAAHLLLNGLQQQQPDQQISIYHFTHIENALSIIKDESIKSRASAFFKDSAGSGIIGQTELERKQFARFYFRVKTPTQYYIENWGRGERSMVRLSNEPVCPIPVFFIIPIEEGLKSPDWSVSLGTLASPQVIFGNNFELVSQFDFQHVYRRKEEIAHERYMAAAHQEFLVKGQLDLSTIQYRLVVQNEAARKSLLAMLNNDAKWPKRVDIDPTLFYGNNPQVGIVSSDDELSATAPLQRSGEFILQYKEDETWKHLCSDTTDQYRTLQLITTISKERISIKGRLKEVTFNLFYTYKGQLWLVHTNSSDNNFNDDYLKAPIQRWQQSSEDTVEEILDILALHPLLKYWYSQKVGGPDDLTLREHTKAVIEFFLRYFKGKQTVFENDHQFVLFLALHDIGKPVAITMGNKSYQHAQTLILIDRIKNIIPFDATITERMKILVNGDIIGNYLNPNIGISVDDSVLSLQKLAVKLDLPIEKIWQNLIMYYQADAGGYKTLANRLFSSNDVDSLQMGKDGMRIMFNEEYENKFAELAESVSNLRV